MTDEIDDPNAFRSVLDRARDGQREALDQLLTRLETRFREDAERRVGQALSGRTRISDILQDAYLEVVRGISSFAGATEAEFFVWVSRIIESSARGQHRYLTAKRRKAPSRTTELNALATAYLKTVTSPLSDLQRIEDVSSVHKALAELREDYRIVIEQLVLLGRDVEEVAQSLQRSEAATRMLLSRARAALTIKLDQLRDPDR